MWHMGNGWGWWMGFGSLGMVLVLALVMWAIDALVQRSGAEDGEPGHAQAPSALALLDGRYARGDISAAEFEEMRGRLTHQAGVGGRLPPGQ